MMVKKAGPVPETELDERLGEVVGLPGYLQLMSIWGKKMRSVQNRAERNRQNRTERYQSGYVEKIRDGKDRRAQVNNGQQ